MEKRRDLSVYCAALTFFVGLSAAVLLLTGSQSQAQTTNCIPPFSGLASWWPGEGDGVDVVGGNSGVGFNGVGFVPGRVGQAMRFNGTNSYVEVPDAPSLRMAEEVTVEFWVRRLRLDYYDYIVEKGGDWTGDALNYGVALHIGQYNYCLHFTFDGGWRGAGRIDDLEWHHCAVVARHGAVDPEFYIDGVLQPVLYRAGLPAIVLRTSGRPLHIGAQVDPVTGWSYYSKAEIDELAIYNRALTSAEIQAVFNAGGAGKCQIVIPPSIVTEPEDQSVLAGTDISFRVVAAGTMPLSYQWLFNGFDLPGATDSTLVLSNVQAFQSGSYSAVVTNAGGMAVSRAAELRVNFPPTRVELHPSAVPAGGTVTLPLSLAANGNENAIGFSLAFDRALLSYSGIALDNAILGAVLFVNTNEVTNGKLGVAIALPSGTTLPAGTQTVVHISFAAAVIMNSASTAVTFGDTPIGRQLADAEGNALPAVYAGAGVDIAGAQFEGDVSPRPNGNQDVQITDWVLVGRYVVRTDYPTNSAEFQRADCAPRATLGDGAIKVTDWVQAGRYAARLDPLTPLGGPEIETQVLGGARPDQPAVLPGSGLRELTVVPALFLQGQTGTVCILLEAQGDENAVGFSLAFDSSQLAYAGSIVGKDAGNATLNHNTSQASVGRLGFALSLNPGTTFAAGPRELVKVHFRAASSAEGALAATFADRPVPCEISSVGAQSLDAQYVTGSIVVNPPPRLAIHQYGGDVFLTWPAWASNFVIQEAGENISQWTNSEMTPSLASGIYNLVVPAGLKSRFFRLYQP